MKNRSNFLIYSLLLMGVLFVFASSCKKDDDEEQEPVESLSENAVVIDKTDWENSIISYDTVNKTIIFNDNIEAMNLKIGDIIVSAADEGILRKVSEISDEEGTIIVQTDDADLEDVIENGEFDIEQPLTVSDLKGIDYHYKGISLNPSCMKQSDNTNFTWDINAVIHDADGNENTTGDQIRLEGEFTCSWDIYMNVKISWFKVKKVTAGFEATEDLDLKLLADIGFDFEKSITLMTVNFNNITVWVAGLPVVIKPVLEINVGIEGFATANITTSVSQSLYFDAGIEYNKGAGWSSYEENEKSFQYNPPQLNVNAEAVAYLGPKLILKIYGVEGPYIDARLYGKLVTDMSAYPESPWWSLSGGIDLGAGVRVKILGDLYDIRYDHLIIYEVPITQSTTSPPEMPVVSTTEITNITEVSATGGGNITYEGGSPVTERGVCWSTTQTPTIYDNITSDGTGIGSFVSNISGLTANTIYYVRAYATNSAGTGYGSPFEFRTEGGTIVVTLDNIDPDIVANETWTESGVILSLQEYNGNINFGIQTDGIWLFGCLLHADLSGVQGTIEEVQVDVLDGCGGNSLVAKLFDSGVEIADAVSASNGESTLSLINPNPGVDIPDVLTVSGSCESKVTEIRIILQPN